MRTVAKLSAKAREAARHELLGKSARVIAEAVGCDPRQVANWRASEVYRDHLMKLQREADEDAIRKAGAVRADAIKLGHAAIGMAASKLAKARKMSEVVEASKVAHDWYRTTSAQTGLVETTRQAVEVSAPEEVRKLLRQDLDALTDDELDALRARRST